MANHFMTNPEPLGHSSTTFLPLNSPTERLEALMEEAQLQRGSLREVDGYTIPFREGGQVRIVLQEDGEQPGLHFTASAASDDRLAHLQESVQENLVSAFDDAPVLEWTRA